MPLTETNRLLHFFDPQTNSAKFYEMSIQPNLCGGLSLIKNWGGLGSHGQFRVELYDATKEAEDALERHLRMTLHRGYVEISPMFGEVGAPGQCIR